MTDFKSLRDYLARNAPKMTYKSDVDDLVQDTIVNLWTSEIFREIELTASETRSFAYTAMIHLARNKRRDARRRARAFGEMAKFRMSYQPDCSRQVEIQDSISNMSQRDLTVLSMIGDGASVQDCAGVDGLSKNDSARVRRLLSSEVLS